jgi:hypothetical protein
MTKKHESSGWVSSALFVLVVVLITLKLSGVIDWPWYGVLAPVWVPVAGVGVVCLLMIAFYAIVMAVCGVVLGCCAISDGLEKLRQRRAK